MIKEEYFELSNGVKMPKVGFGTWMINNEDCIEAVKNAIKAGYRYIDTARDYANEVEVGKAIKESGIAREDIFVQTKISAFSKTYEEAKCNIEDSLRNLDLDYIDSVVIHAPEPWTNYKDGGNHFFEGNKEAWRAMEEMYKSGKIKAIGVSNFEIIDLEHLMETAEVKPMVNQILTHIANTPFKLINYCKENGIQVEAYSPIGHGEIMKREDIKAIADKYGKTIPQICIRYCLQLDLAPLPKANSYEHIAENIDCDFEISDEDMNFLKNVEPIKNYGESSGFPVYGGKMITPTEYEKRDFRELIRDE